MSNDAAALVRDIQDATKCLNGREAMGGHAAEAVASLSQKMAKGMALRVASLPFLHAKGAQMLTEALAVSAYGVEGKKDTGSNRSWS